MSFWDFALYLRALPTFLLAWVTWVMTRSPAQQRLNRILAAFLGVVAFGFFFEFVARLAVPEPGPSLSPAADMVYSSATVLHRLAGLIDPPLLLAYALNFPQARPMANSRLLWGGYAAAVPLLLVGAFPQTFQPNLLRDLPEALYVNGTYIAAFLVLLDSYVRENRRYLARQLFFVCLAVGFVGLSRSIAIIDPMRDPFPTELLYVMRPLAALGLSLLVLAGIAVWHRQRSTGSVRSAGPVMGRLALILLAFFGAYGAIWWSAFTTGWAATLATPYYSYRWIVFTALIGYGVLRYQLFDFDYRTRQATTFLAALGIGLIAGFGAGMFAVGRGMPPFAARIWGALGGFGCGLLSYFAIRPLTRGRDGAGPARYRERRMEIYEATLEFTLQRGTLTRDDELLVETLREILEVSPEEHAQVMARLRPTAGPSSTPNPSP